MRAICALFLGAAVLALMASLAACGSNGLPPGCQQARQRAYAAERAANAAPVALMLHEDQVAHQLFVKAVAVCR